MNFFEYEIENMIEHFPGEKATLEKDLTDLELTAISEMGILKNSSHYYLGVYFIFQNLNLNKFLRFENKILPK